MTFLPSTHTQKHLDHLLRGWGGAGRDLRPVAGAFGCLATGSSATAFFLMKVFHNSLCDYLCRIPRRITSELLNLIKGNFASKQFCTTVFTVSPHFTSWDYRWLIWWHFQTPLFQLWFDK